MILVTSANGNQGKLLIPKLLAAGATVRACVRTETSGAILRAEGVTDVVVGDMSDTDVMARAMQGVEKIYHVSPTLQPMERETGFAAVDAAKANGVKHFVLSFVLHAITTDLIQHEMKRDIEEHLLSSGLAFTILQPANYMLPYRLRPVFESGVFRLPWSLERYQSLVDLGDVTEVVAAVLADSERHAYATYELAAPGHYLAEDLAAIISEVVGRPISVEQIGVEAFLAGMGPSEGSYTERLLRAICARYSSHDFVGNPNVLTWLLGRPPTSYEQFVRAQYEAYRTGKTAP